MELATKALKPSGAAPTSQPGGTTTAVSYQSSNDVYSSSPSKSATDTSSVISFVMPMSTSTPKSACQPPTSKPESLATSPSMSYPVMSLIRAVSPRTEQSQSKMQSHGEMKVKVHEYKSEGEDDKGREKTSDSKSGKSVEFRSEPAVLPVTSSETAAQKKGAKKSEKSYADKPNTTEINNQKSAARAAFFSSLTSPQTPTTVTTPTTSVSSLSTDSPTEVYSKISPGVNVSPIKGIPSLVHSTAVSMPSSSLSASAIQSHVPSSATKPSSLPVSGSSVVSTQRFSPVSPSGNTKQITVKPRTSFTAIPKPYSPTKSTPSPLTPESPRYRVPPSQQTIIYSQPGKDSGKKTSLLKQPKDISVRPKKVPPPPPPRKSSRVPGHAVLAVNAATVNGQLTKPKLSDTKVAQETKSKDHSDIIKPPKQFANIELDTKVERKSSIGSLKQFTTPLLESKRDKSLEKDRSVDKDQKPPEMVGKKISSTNLDTEDEKSFKQIEKDLDLSKEEKSGKHDLDESSKKIIDGKVTNISAEKSSRTLREGSIESTSSSSSLDSQQEVWVKKRHDLSDTSSLVTQSSQEGADVSSASIETVKTVPEDKNKPSEDGTGKKPKPPPPERRSSLTSKSRTESEPDDKPDGKDSKGSIDRLV